MQFAVGQNIVHPSHGAGTVIDVQNQELVEGFRRYYVIRFDGKRLTVHVPFRRTDEVGLRKVMSRSKCQDVLDTLRKLPKPLPSNFKERRKLIENLIHSGQPTKIAEAVRELNWRGEEKRLNTADSDLLAQGREMLIQEMALATGADPAEIQQRIDRALEASVQAKLAEQNRGVEH
ncbi:MAG: hypothetical protein KatS3mg050_2694 [Litorilinea sp.]|nr:MAG: hypothetical protein KatS3mg050_2694 [Litorilinea sp.]